MPIHPLSYLLVFIVPALVPLSYWLGQISGLPNAMTFLPLLVLYVILPFADQLLGVNSKNIDSDIITQNGERGFFKLLPLLCVPVQLFMIIWGAYIFSNEPSFNLLGQLGWILSVGFSSGTIAINAAHELIHKRTRLEQWSGGILLSTVFYAGFKIEHVRGHHVHVSTPQDASSAPMGQSLYQFLPKAAWKNFSNAWRLEQSRLERIGLSSVHYRNELLWWYGLSLLFSLGLMSLFGWAAVVFFVAQAMQAIYSLETINYIEHYGLERQKMTSGRYERPNHHHSWNSSHQISNMFLFQLARHSDHHANPTRRYPALRHFDDSPQLPASYAAMMWLAAIPPLWHKIMDPLAIKALAKSHNE